VLSERARVLIVRLGALGDIVHAVPVLTALRAARPALQVDWLVEEAYLPVLELVDGLRRRIIVRARDGSRPGDDVSRPRFTAGAGGYVKAVRFLRAQRYDVALDLQGLLKSAVWARASGAQRVVGFAPAHLRERQAAWFYTETVVPPAPSHVIHKNLAIAAHLGVDASTVSVPLSVAPSAALAEAVSGAVGAARYAVLNPGAAWPNKRWPAARFGALAASLLHRHGLVSFVTWGPAERSLAEEIVRVSDGAARLAPPTTVRELAALLGGAALVVSGDTGPLHIAAAVGTPLVGLFGPTRPERNGPWDARDEVVSRAAVCQCHHKRQCQIGAPCIEGIALDEVVAAVDRRLAREQETR
jgi:heptosyltransferase I